MASDLTQERQKAQALLERLSAEKLRVVRSLLEVIVDDDKEVTDATLSNAPIDDEPETDAERVAVAQARTSLEKSEGKGIPHSEAMRRLGLE